MGDVVIFLWGLWVYGGMNVGTLQMLQQWTRACLCGCLKEKEDKEEEVLLCSTAHTGTDVAMMDSRLPVCMSRRRRRRRS